MNQKVGKGSIMSQLGWACSSNIEDDEPSEKIIFFDFEHGMCEMWEPKK